MAQNIRFSPLVVGLLVAWFSVDFGGRFLPVEWLHVLPEHIATRRPGRYSPFIPNLRLRHDPWIGETAMTGNLRPTETRAPVTFSTDAWGFRLTPGVPPGSQFTLLLHEGASFAYGGGLSDNETLPAVITREMGIRMYNGGHFFWDKPGPEPLDDLLLKTGRQKPTIVLLEWEQADHERTQLEGLPWRLDRPGKALVGAVRYAQLRDDLQYGRRYLNAIFNISPLEVLAIRFFKSLSNDELLPNRYQAAVEARTAPDGKRILFLAKEVQRTLHPPDEGQIQARAAYFDLYRQLLAKRQLDVYIVLLPNKYTLYGPILDRIPGSPYLDRLEQALTAKGIHTLNMLPMFRQLAAGELDSGEYSYYREDHHWSPKGVRITAAALATRLRSDQSISAKLTHAVQ